MSWALALGTWLAACSGTAPLCEDPDAELAEGSGVTCQDAQVVELWAELLAARDLTEGQADRLRRELRTLAGRDAADTLARVDAARQEAGALRAAHGLKAGELRAHRAYAQLHGEGPFPASVSEGMNEVVDQAVAVWATDAEAQLVFTEMDVEGWIRLASLAREVQGGTPLQISVADRVVVYRMIPEAWSALPRDEQVAMSSVGPFWLAIRDAWKGASYETQQAYIHAAPLPPPMTATSLAYLEAVLEQDASRHAKAVHGALGPLRIPVAN